MNSYPNSDCKQCTELKLGWVHSAHTQKPGIAHTVRSAQVVGAAARTADWSPACRAHNQLRSRAQREQVALIAPRLWAHVATSFLIHPQARLRHRSQVATSWTTKPGRDVNPMSRPPFCLTKTVQVATSKMGSRHQFPWGSENHVATSNRCRNITQPNPGRDLKTGSRHRFSCLASSQVATPKPGRDHPGD